MTREFTNHTSLRDPESIFMALPALGVSITHHAHRIHCTSCLRDSVTEGHSMQQTAHVGARYAQHVRGSLCKRMRELFETAAPHLLRLAQGMMPLKRGGVSL